MTRRAKAGIGTTLGVLFISWSLLLTPAHSCPFCTAVRSTLSEEFAMMDAVVLARLVKSAPPGSAAEDLTKVDQSINSSIAHFTVEKILKGEKLVGSSNSFSTSFFGDARRGDLFLVSASDPKNLTWSAPLLLNDRQREYILNLIPLPKEGPKRLAFFQKYLGDPDEMLARDAYDEFARAPYSAVKQLKSEMNRDQLVKWIEDPEVSASHRRLYLTMLGICGSIDDLPMLEKRLRSEDAAAKSGLDALIACYLTLRGVKGVELVEDLYLKKQDGNFSGNYADVYAAIMALRFHGSEGDVIPRARVLKAFEHLLDNPQMADLIISDLARWEDWSQLDRLVKLFETADTKSTFLRMPIINYARACPLPEAKKALEEFEKIDPQAVKRAMTFFPTLSGDSK